MKRILIISIVALITTYKAYSQCACCAGASAGSSNNLCNNGNLTLPKKQWLVEGYGDFRTIKEGGGHHESSDDTTTIVEEETPLKSMLITSLGLRYGITDKITVSALLPYAFLNTDKGNDKGLGDLILLGTFSILKRNNFNLALRGGVELPTGVQKGATFDNTTVVIGSGSIDPMAGVVFSQKWNRFILQGDGLFKYTTRGFEETNFGSLAIQNVSLSYKIKANKEVSKPDSTTDEKLSLSVFGGYYGEWLDKIKVQDEVDENSGYYLEFATIGTSLTLNKITIPLTFSYPIVQAMNGSQSDSGFRLRIGVQKLF